MTTFVSTGRKSPRRRSRIRGVLLACLVVLALLAATAGAALLVWPDPALAADDDALAHVDVSWLAGDVTRIVVHDDRGRVVPVRLTATGVVPRRPVRAGDRLTLDLTVKRPGWAAWLVGHTTHRTLTVTAPTAELRSRWVEVRSGAPLMLEFDRPVRVVKLRVGSTQRTVRAGSTSVRVGVPGKGLAAAGRVTVRSAPRPWERLSSPRPVHWFTRLPEAQALVEPAPGATVGARTPITLTFSRPVEVAIGKALPTLTPPVAGRWQRLDSHTLAFVPSGLGFPLDTHVDVRLPRPVRLATAGAQKTTRSLRWPTPTGSMLRLEQLLAEQGYLPVEWAPTGTPVARTAAAQVAAVATPPAGRFHWPHLDSTPRELRGLWQTGKWNAIVRGAVMRFQDTHHLDVDAFVGPAVWRALLADALAGKRLQGGYSYVYVHRDVPQLLTLWHDGAVVLTSPGNTGVPAAPTELGTFPVFEHIPVGRMSGTNPDGTHYDDPGIRWISYFNHGEALHAFPRASFGTPQSLGCVELPLAAAATVWPYTPIGTLVTIEH